MKLLARHVVLAAGNSCEDARDQVLHFFESTSLVNYDKIIIPDDGEMVGTDPGFDGRLSRGLERNKEILAKFMAELEAAHPGIGSVFLPDGIYVISPDAEGEPVDPEADDITWYDSPSASTAVIDISALPSPIE